MNRHPCPPLGVPVYVYRLPSGDVVRIAHDYRSGAHPPLTTTHQLADGSLAIATRIDALPGDTYTAPCAPGPFGPIAKPGPRTYVGTRPDGEGWEPCWECGAARGAHLVVLGETMPRCPAQPVPPSQSMIALLDAIAEVPHGGVIWIQLRGDAAANALEVWAAARGYAPRREEIAWTSTIDGTTVQSTRLSVRLPNGGEVTALRDDRRTVQP